LSYDHRFEGSLDYLNFGVRQGDFRLDHSPWGF